MRSMFGNCVSARRSNGCHIDWRRSGEAEEKEEDEAEKGEKEVKLRDKAKVLILSPGVCEYAIYIIMYIYIGWLGWMRAQSLLSPYKIHTHIYMYIIDCHFSMAIGVDVAYFIFRAMRSTRRGKKRRTITNATHPNACMPSIRVFVQGNHTYAHIRFLFFFHLFLC